MLALHNVINTGYESAIALVMISLRESYDFAAQKLGYDRSVSFNLPAGNHNYAKRIITHNLRERAIITYCAFPVKVKCTIDRPRPR